MIYSCNLIRSANLCDRLTNMVTAAPFTFTDPSLTNSRHNHQRQRNKKQPNCLNPLKLPPCDQSGASAIDVVIFIAVLGAAGFLVFLYVKLFFYGVSGIAGVILSAVTYGVGRLPMVYASIGLSIFAAAAIGVWGISKWTRTGKKCGIPNCRGLRHSVEFDIQIQSEETLKNSVPLSKGGAVQGLLEFVQDRHRDLENELRKIAPANGRAVIVFRARCGCPIGRMEVAGPKKLRKVKK